MLESIINFFKNLFSSNKVETVQNTITETESTAESTTVKTKLLINNCLNGYKLVEVLLATGTRIMYCNDIPEKDSIVVVFETDKNPEEFYLKCMVESMENGERIGPQGMIIKNNGNGFVTVNATDTNLGLNRITFNAAVEDISEKTH